MKEVDGLTDLEVISLINKKKKKYCAMFLDELENHNLEEQQFKSIRKAFLDIINSYTRGLCSVIGIEVEGIRE